MQAPDEPEPVYDLFAVSNHFNGVDGGHCKLPWYMCSMYMYMYMYVRMYMYVGVRVCVCECVCV